MKFLRKKFKNTVIIKFDAVSANTVLPTTLLPHPPAKKKEIDFIF